MTDTATDDELVSLPALAQMMGIASPTVYGWVRVGVAGHKLRAFRCGRFYMIRPSWLAAFIEATQR